MAGDEKLLKLIHSMEKDVRGRLIHMEKKLDYVCNLAAGACSVPTPMGGGSSSYPEGGSTGGLFSRHGSSGIDEKRVISTSSLYRQKSSDDWLHSGLPGSLAIQPRTLSLTNLKDGDERKPQFRRSNFTLPSLRLPNSRGSLELEAQEPPLPSAMPEPLVDPPGTPAWLEPSQPWTREASSHTLGEHAVSERSSMATFVATGAANNVPAPETRVRRDSLASTTSSNSAARVRAKDSVASSGTTGSIAMLKAKITAVRTKRGAMEMAIWQFLEEADSSTGAWIFSLVLQLVVLANVFFCLLHTTKPPVLSGLGAMVVHLLFDAIFALEVLVRFFVCPNRCTFFTYGSNWIDLAAALPLFMNLVQCIKEECDSSATQYEIMVILPVLRLLKLLRSFEKFHLLLNAFWLAFEALPVLLYTLSLLVLSFAAMIYLLEPRSNIDTLPESLWLTIVTMTTVGYGDVTPQSSGGTILVSVLIVGSALYMAIPLGIVGGSFSRVWEDRDRLVLIRRTRNRLLQWGWTAKDVLELFYLFDSDRSGELDLGEFEEMIREMRLGINTERVMNLFKTFDSDGSGKVDDEEFVRALFPKAYPALYQHALDEEDEETEAAEGTAKGDAGESNECLKTLT